MKRAALVLLLALAACATSRESAVPSAPAAATAPSDDWRAKIDALCAEWTAPGSPGCAIGVIRDGELVFAHGYGLANLEHSLPITSRTVFDIGSTSKQFTAACIGLLQQDGALSIDDDLRKWIPEIPDYGSKITLAHLLHHTSGLRDYLELFSFAGRKTEDWTTSAQALAVLSRQKALNFEPGAEHVYCNSGYFLLSLVVERASGKSLARFAKERVFDPLEMRDTHFHDDHTLLVPRRAAAYSRRDDGTFGIDMSDFEQTGDGGVMTTVEDLAKWDANFYTHRVGGDELQRFLHERGKLNDGTELRYASGLFVDTYRGVKRVSHGGAWAGYRAELMRFPEQRCSVICLANLGSIATTRTCEQIAINVLGDALAEEKRNEAAATAPAQRGEPSARPSPPSLSAEELLAYAGIYESDELETRAEIAVANGHLAIGEVGFADFELTPREKDRFAAPGMALEFVRDEAGAITGFKCSSTRMRNLWFARLKR